MNLLSRYSRPLALVVVLLALSTLSMSGPSPHEFDFLSATPAWAGGSPDETLNPTPTPPRSRFAPTVDGGTNWTAEAASTGATRRTTWGTLSWKERIGIAYRIFLASKLRF